jgi:hypothetical protein
MVQILCTLTAAIELTEECGKRLARNFEASASPKAIPIAGHNMDTDPGDQGYRLPVLAWGMDLDQSIMMV